MTRLKQAWLALCGKLEPEVVVNHRVVYLPAPDGWENVYSVTVGGSMFEPEFEHFSTCEQAHKAHVGKLVKCNVVAVIGGRTFLVGGLREVDVQPKPKIAKGKRK